MEEQPFEKAMREIRENPQYDFTYTIKNSQMNAMLMRHFPRGWPKELTDFLADFETTCASQPCSKRHVDDEEAWQNKNVL